MADKKGFRGMCDSTPGSGTGRMPDDQPYEKKTPDWKGLSDSKPDASPEPRKND